MDSRGGCCIARYAGAGGVYDMSKVDRIMLRFRPIAPKPTAGGSVFPPVNSEIYSKSGRGKRRSSNKNNSASSNSSNTNNNNSSREGTKRCNRKRRVSNEETKRGFDEEQGVTLPLLPETPASDGSRNSSPEFGSRKAKPVWLNFGQMGPNQQVTFGISADRTAVIRPPHTVAGCCVTVECVTETWVDGNGLGSTDEERKVNLAKDTCPGFVSDGFERVTLTNAAFRDMVGGGDPAGMGVCLVMKEWPMLTYPAFTCRVRVQSGKDKTSLTLPCDVWRMDGGGLVWRLDITAALRLGPV